MKKYKVEIPPPLSKRLIGLGRVIINLYSGWGGWDAIETKEYSIFAEIEIFNFELPDEYEYSGSTSIIDGYTFNVICEYSNLSGSRKEKYILKPEQLL